MNGKTRGELILFPKTIDYYQIELTKLLEREAYGEAIRMLEFLVGCTTEDGRTNEEWSTLLRWLSSEFPDAARAGTAPAELGDAGETGEAGEAGEAGEPSPAEDELLRRHVSEKAAKDGRYAARLLDMLSRSSVDRQLAALEQLAHLEDDSVNEALLRRLTESQLHPFVSFKLLQTLARLGAEGEATFARLGEIVTVDIERTPTSPDRFPEPLKAVSERVREESESTDPTIHLFAKQTWEEFLIYVYGTAAYREMLHETDESALDVWACALHAAVARAMYGDGEGDGFAGELRDRYMITEAMRPAWEKAYASLAAFFRRVSGVHV